MKSKLLFLVLFATLSFIGFSQSEVENWTVLNEQEGVVISEKLADCAIPQEGFYAEYYLIKIENTSSQAVSVSYEKEIYYKGKLASNDSQVPSYTLQPGEKVEGSCELGTDQNLKIFNKWTKRENTRTLTSHSLKNITIKNITH